MESESLRRHTRRSFRQRDLFGENRLPPSKLLAQPLWKTTLHGMSGPEILTRSLSVAVPTGISRGLWQYHSRGDRHSKIACWGILFDVIRNCAVLRKHIAVGRIGFGINHEMRDFRENRRKNLDLVLCVPNGGPGPASPATFASLVERYSIILSSAEQQALAKLPLLRQTPVGAVHVALEAKACMTEHSKARPRLYDELNSSHLTIHGASSTAIAVGFVLINLADEFFSPSRSVVSRHRQPGAAAVVLEKILQLPRRSSTTESGFDAIAAVMIRCRNDGKTAVELVSDSPAPASGDVMNYRQMIRRVAHLYESRFPML